MNERIKELQKAAGIQAVRTLMREDDNTEVKLMLTEAQLAKFAELIVRECADICEDEDDGSIDTKSVRLAMIRIKKHFGINSSDNIRAGAEIHSDKGYSESTQEKYEEAKQRREDRREIKSSLGYSRVGMWGRK